MTIDAGGKEIMLEVDRRVAIGDVARVEGLIIELDEKIAELNKRRDSLLRQSGASAREAAMLAKQIKAERPQPEVKTK